MTRGQLDSRGHWLLVFAIIALTVTGTLFYAAGTAEPGEFEQANDEIVTNCDLGGGCGMLPLVKLTVGIAAVVVVVSYVISLPKWPTDERE